MADTPVSAPVPPPTVASLADAQGYVSVYDHGPQPPAADATQAVKDVTAAEKKAWDVLYPDGVAVLRMATTDASTALVSAPERYALEPDIDEGAITAKMAEIRKRREAMIKAKEDVADRQQAIGEVMSDMANKRAAAVVVEPVKPVKPAMRPAGVEPVVPPKPVPPVVPPVVPSPQPGGPVVQPAPKPGAA